MFIYCVMHEKQHYIYNWVILVFDIGFFFSCAYILYRYDEINNIVSLIVSYRDSTAILGSFQTKLYR